MPETTWSDGDNVTAALLNQIEDQIVVTCTSSTRPTGVEGRVIFETDTNKIMIYNGTAWRVCGGSGWVTFTPSWTNLTVGNGTNTGRYRHAAGGIWVAADITFGSTTTISGSVSLTVPNSESNAIAVTVTGHCDFFDSTTGKNWTGHTNTATTSISLYANDDNINATNPVAYATSDVIHVMAFIPL